MRTQALLVTIGLIWLRCSNPIEFTCSFEETSRITSPDGVVEAVAVTGNCGATTPISLSTYIVPSGTPYDATDPRFQSDYSLFSVDHFDGFDMHWDQPRLLVLHYKIARIFKFTNFWSSAQIENHRYLVELRLAPESNDFSLHESDRN